MMILRQVYLMGDSGLALLVPIKWHDPKTKSENVHLKLEIFSNESNDEKKDP
jgi:hypothetical protein